jgi:hypothetical protein
VAPKYNLIHDAQQGAENKDGLNLNISVITRERFRLTDFYSALYMTETDNTHNTTIHVRLNIRILQEETEKFSA